MSQDAQNQRIQESNYTDKTSGSDILQSSTKVAGFLMFCHRTDRCSSKLRMEVVTGSSRRVCTLFRQREQSYVNTVKSLTQCGTVKTQAVLEHETN